MEPQVPLDRLGCARIGAGALDLPLHIAERELGEGRDLLLGLVRVLSRGTARRTMNQQAALALPAPALDERGDLRRSRWLLPLGRPVMMSTS
ncbi:hypothetical protein PPSIR1_17615 [Plesiocystis pacifica SIR-1]|uniref:Uncharacterized protein n=1 Tax=Plesiocystis pacifica SIR-1 TaxID=391625 RepID=A6GIW4_9BACT|nr:hypothetical protein PPSIR1_17615 [Plesiocystis pacifica SIR-1]